MARRHRKGCCCHHRRRHHRHHHHHNDQQPEQQPEQQQQEPTKQTIEIVMNADNSSVSQFTVLSNGPTYTTILISRADTDAGADNNDTQPPRSPSYSPPSPPPPRAPVVGRPNIRLHRVPQTLKTELK